MSPFTHQITPIQPGQIWYLLGKLPVLVLRKCPKSPRYWGLFLRSAATNPLHPQGTVMRCGPLLAKPVQARYLITDAECKYAGSQRHLIAKFDLLVDVKQPVQYMSIKPPKESSANEND